MYCIFLIFCIYTVSPVFLIEIFIHHATEPSFADNMIFLQFSIFLYMQLFSYIMGLFVISDFCSSKFILYFMILATITEIITAYNPWTAWYFENAENAVTVIKYSLMLQLFHHPISILVSIFITWISFRMRRIDRDYEPYKVIYGGEDSETKKVMKPPEFFV
ncbi:hypothetical protein B9Z55_008124 [Caenorhabditis nigoni]|uniref:Uncharacterized protein n=1 Tax=Caenorhabditis nigoni TaxID=1611254 RepID=A0A2G5VCQ9_9PELO|nr:hypothetical protein B9Z55_008124 [Caenorhabditis nigoni]